MKPYIVIASLLLVASVSFAYLLRSKKPDQTAIVKAAKINSNSSAKYTYIIQPFADITNDEADYIFKKLKIILPNVITTQRVDLPKSAYYSPRKRYLADSIISWLSRRTNANCTTIGLTSKDISVRKGTNPNYGIMGLSYNPGKACVASSFRLHTNLKNQELFKVTIHELGHTQGLNHCPTKTCIMRDAEGKNTTGEEIGFCEICSKKLVARGWKNLEKLF